MKNKITGIISAVMGLVLAVGVMTVFRACPIKEDGTWMHCHSAQTTVMYLALAMAVVSAVTVFVKNKAVNIGLYAVNLILSVVTMLIPQTIIHMCMMNTMRCHAIMRPFSTIMAVLILIVSAVGIVFHIKVEKTKTPSHA